MSDKVFVYLMLVALPWLGWCVRARADAGHPVALDLVMVALVVLGAAAHVRLIGSGKDRDRSGAPEPVDDGSAKEAA